MEDAQGTDVEWRVSDAAVAYPDAPPEAWRWHGLELIKQGRSGEGKAALSRYLQMKPTAADAPFIRQMAS